MMRDVTMKRITGKHGWLDITLLRGANLFEDYLKDSSDNGELNELQIFYMLR